MSWNQKKKGGRGIFKLPEAKKDSTKKPAGAAGAPKEEEEQVDVNQQLIKANEEIKSLSAELEKVNRDLDSQNGLNTKTIAMNIGLKEQCRKKDEEIRIKEALVLSKEIEIASFKLEIKGLKDSNEKAKEQIERLNAQVASAVPNDEEKLHAKIIDLEFKINTQDTEIEALKQGGDGAKVKEQIDEVIRLYDEKMKAIKVLLDDANAKFDNHVKIIQENETKIQDLEQTIAKNELDYQKAELDSTATIDRLNKNIKTLEGNIRTSEAESIQENAQFNKQIKELTATIETRDQTIAGLEATVSSDKKIKDDQVETIKKSNETIAEQAKNITDLGETIKGLQETNKQVEEGRKEFQTKFQTANIDLHSMTQLRDKLQKQKDAVTTDGTMKVLQDQVNTLTREKGDLDKRILDKDEQIDELSSLVMLRIISSYFSGMGS
jgi:chromosome segregation ATPase